MLSIDVGIKNLACVILEFDDDAFSPSKIIKWEVLDLTDRVLCEEQTCSDVAQFQDMCNRVLCKKHAKAAGTGLLIPKPCDKVKNIKKLKLVDLREYAAGRGIEYDKVLKVDLMKKVEECVKTTYYTDIHTARADQHDLITLGRMLKTKMEEFMGDIDVDVVCIENQISHLANRMKTLQGMITQYFIMISECAVEFVSSINKLKELNMESSTYAERKKEGIILCRSKIADYNAEWCGFFDKSKKKDDLSDCYLQGLYCIKKIREGNGDGKCKCV